MAMTDHKHMADPHSDCAIHGDHVDATDPVCERAQRMQDVLLVSSFALWAMVLGFAPVMTWRLLIG